MYSEIQMRPQNDWLIEIWLVKLKTMDVEYIELQ